MEQKYQLRLFLLSLLVVPWLWFLVQDEGRNMSLEFILMARLAKSDGEITGSTNSGEWRPEDLQGKPQKIVNVASGTTATGVLVFRLQAIGQLERLVGDLKVKRWQDVGYPNLRLRIEDKVSGKFVMCDVFHYPPAKIFPTGDLE